MTPEEKTVLKQAAAILTKHQIASAPEGFVVSFGTHPPSSDCSADSVSIGVLWNGKVWTGHSTDFESAVGIARAKIADEKARLAVEAEKRPKPRSRTTIDRMHEGASQ